MSWETPPPNYEIKPGDEVQITLRTGVFGPPLWAIEDVFSVTSWEFLEGAYEESDLVLRLRKRAGSGGPEIIQAAAIPGYIVGLLATLGIGIVAFLVVKDVRVWRTASGDWGVETETSIPAVVIIAAVGAGLIWLGQKR